MGGAHIYCLCILGKPVREHESAIKRQRRMKHLLKHFAGKAARGLDSKWKEGEDLPPSVEAALARHLSEGRGIFGDVRCSVG